MIEIKRELPRAVLIGVNLKQDDELKTESTLQELSRLAATAGITVLGYHIQNRRKIDAATYVGKGFLHAVLAGYDKIDMLIFANELQPNQMRNITSFFEVEVADRTEIILDIFHRHARTKEAKVQVRLAELVYQLPRLKKLWSHLDRERGQVSGSSGTARGMGEKQLEVDKRKIRQEILHLQDQLKRIEIQKNVQRKRRQQIGKVCIIGYTNAGKSTLFNSLTAADVLVEDKLFATLDSTTRKLKLTGGRDIILSDTIGFIADLPHHLIASFHTTLQETLDADLLLHIVDAGSARYKEQIAAVERVLQEIGAEKQKKILLLNKIDQLDEPQRMALQAGFPEGILISARLGTNLARLYEEINHSMYQYTVYNFLIPFEKQNLVNELYQICRIRREEYREEGILITAEMHQADHYRYARYDVGRRKNELHD